MARQTMTCKRGILLGRFLAMVMAVGLAFGATGGEVAVTSVSASQRYPKDGKVDITITLTGASNDVAEAACSFVATNSATGAALDIAHIVAVNGAIGSDTTWQRRFVWNATVDVGEVKIDDVILSAFAEAHPCGVRLWENGPFWAECNVGATKPEECGYYFWWGGTVGYKRNANSDGWISAENAEAFSFTRDNCPTFIMTDSQLLSAGYTDLAGNLEAAYDAATAHLGAPWRMPTEADYVALVTGCTMAFVKTNGVSGLLVTGMGAYASKSIFLPAAGVTFGSGLTAPNSGGYYWSSTVYSADPYYAWYLSFSSDGFIPGKGSRDGGQPVRPVRVLSQAPSATTHLELDCRVGVSIVGVTAQQRYPWNGEVDVAVTLTGASNDVVNAAYTFVATNSTTGAALSVAHITAIGDVAGSDTTWQRRFVWNAIADVGEVNVDDVALTVQVEAQFGGVQLWENGPYWAECNVGATKPEEYGYYFWWGDTVGYTRSGGKLMENGSYRDVAWVSSQGVRMSNSPFRSNACPTYGKKTSELMTVGYIDSTRNLAAAHDAATVHLGVPWRMPSEAEISALISNCNISYTARNGMAGVLVTGKGAFASKTSFCLERVMAVHQLLSLDSPIMAIR